MANGTTGLLRPQFFDRQQLSAADLNAAQSYLRERLRRHNRFLHGWGVVCGAEVHATARSCEVSIGSGYVVTPQGDEIYIPPGATFDMSAGIARCVPTAPPCDQPERLDGGGTTAEMDCINFGLRVQDEGPNPRIVEDVTFTVRSFDGSLPPLTRILESGSSQGLDCGFRLEIALGAPSPLVTLTLVHTSLPATATAFDAAGAIVARAAMTARGGIPETLTLAPAAATISRVVVDAPQNETLLIELCRAAEEAPMGQVYLVVRPREEPMSPQPTVPGNCQPPGGSYQFSRICETFEFDVVCALPPSHQPDPDCETLNEIVCGQAHIPCPPDATNNDVVLATVEVSRAAWSDARIDDLADRRQLLSEALTLAYLRCQCNAVPLPGPIIRAIRPDEVTRGRLPVTLTATISGERLEGAGEVTFAGGGITASLVSSPTASTIQLTVVVQPTAALGPRSFLVFFPDRQLTVDSASFGVFLTVVESAPPTDFTDFTRFTDFTLFTLFTDFTQFTDFPITDFSLFTQFTQFTDFITDFSLFTEFTRFTDFITDFSLFTDFGGGSFFTDFDLPSRFVGPGGPLRPRALDDAEPTTPFRIPFDPQEFDLARGATDPVESLVGIGPERGRVLREAGITSVLEFAAMSADEIATLLRITPVRVAAMQAEAQDRMRRE